MICPNCLKECYAEVRVINSEYPDLNNAVSDCCKVSMARKENANSGYPLLADVLAEIRAKYSERFGYAIVGDIEPVKEVLSKYFR